MKKVGSDDGNGARGVFRTGGERSLGTPREETQRDGEEKHLYFERGGDEVLTITLQQRALTLAPSGRYGLQVTMAHSEDTRLKRLQFDFKSPPAGAGVPSDIYLKQPDGGPWLDIDFRRVEGQQFRGGASGLKERGLPTSRKHDASRPGRKPTLNEPNHETVAP